MGGFESPNYTQAPNDLFDTYLKDMDLAELKVVLAVIRNTMGWHRDNFQMSIRKMAELTGLSIASVQAGAKAAEVRGLIQKNVEGQNSTYWTAVISVSNSDTEVYQNLVHPVSNSDTQLGLNKVKYSERKEINNEPPKSQNGKSKSNTAKKDTIKAEVLNVYVSVLAQVTRMDMGLNYSRLAREAKALHQAGYTAAQLQAAYGPGGAWWRDDWRGKQGQAPQLGIIRSTIAGLGGQVQVEYPEAERERIKAAARERIERGRELQRARAANEIR